MIFTQYYLKCLSHASYLIGDDTTGNRIVIGTIRHRAETRSVPKRDWCAAC